MGDTASMWNLVPVSRSGQIGEPWVESGCCLSYFSHSQCSWCAIGDGLTVPTVILLVPSQARGPGSTSQQNEYIQWIAASPITTAPNNGDRDSLWNRNLFHVYVADSFRRFHCIQSLWKLQILFTNPVTGLWSCRWEMHTGSCNKKNTIFASSILGSLKG
jgi:hypothetical protein